MHTIGIRAINGCQNRITSKSGLCLPHDSNMDRGGQAKRISKAEAPVTVRSNASAHFFALVCIGFLPEKIDQKIAQLKDTATTVLLLSDKLPEVSYAFT